MFDVGFWELTLIGVLALVILGPERLPVVARTVGGWVRRGRQFARNFGEEMTGDSSIRELRDEVQSLKSEIETEGNDAVDRASRMGMSDDLNGHESDESDFWDSDPGSMYEFSLDDVDQVPDSRADDDASEYEADPDVADKRDQGNARPERAGSASEHVDTGFMRGDGTPDDDETDEEALYARARQRYRARTDDADANVTQSDDGRPETDGVEPSDRP